MIATAIILYIVVFKIIPGIGKTVGVGAYNIDQKFPHLLETFFGIFIIGLWFILPNLAYLYGGFMLLFYILFYFMFILPDKIAEKKIENKTVDYSQDKRTQQIIQNIKRMRGQS